MHERLLKSAKIRLCLHGVPVFHASVLRQNLLVTEKTAGNVGTFHDYQQKKKCPDLAGINYMMHPWVVSHISTVRLRLFVLSHSLSLFYSPYSGTKPCSVPVVSGGCWCQPAFTWGLCLVIDIFSTIGLDLYKLFWWAGAAVCWEYALWLEGHRLNSPEQQANVLLQL